MKSNTLIIAEAGVNHNGNEELAFELVELARSKNADIVKFQIFNSDSLVTKSAKKARYQLANTSNADTQHMMLKNLELSYKTHLRIAEHCRKIGIQYLSTAFDAESLRFLAEEVNVGVFKISSGDLTNAPLLLSHARYKKNIILSTGMATLGDIEKALGVLAFGLIDSNELPGETAFENAYYSDVGQALLKKHVTLLHCTTEYPTLPEEVNLKAMMAMHTAFDINVGFSDHSIGNTAPVMAVAFGARIIEKHFTLDKDMVGPDHRASMDPVEFSYFVEAIREAEQCLGDGIKRPAPSELSNKQSARRSLVALDKIREGEVFSHKNVGVKRPGKGVSPFQYWDMLGKASTREYCEGEQL